jgi:Flp pilus assembly pilin Flp
MSAFTRFTIALQTRIRRDDDGASLVEYALLVALIAIVAVVAVTSFGDALFVASHGSRAAPHRAGPCPNMRCPGCSIVGQPSKTMDHRVRIRSLDG